MDGKIAVHGGAGFWRRDIRRALLGVRNASNAGSKILVEGGSAVDAVEAAVAVMEDDPVFNAGRGSSLTYVGTVEMDAAIMDGSDLSAGTVSLVHSVKNPVRLARLVMEKTDHVFLAGPTTEKLAEAYSIPMANPITGERRAGLLRFRRLARQGDVAWVKKNLELVREHPEIIRHDTVGAVAVDGKGDFAAAASTGGTTMKLPGRIGDTPQIGAGLYSDNKSGAVAVTGWGEIAIKLVLSKAVCSMMERGLSSARAAELAVKEVSKRLRGEAGVIAIDRRGRVTAVHNTPYLPWAYSTMKMKCPKVASRGKIVARIR